MPTARATGTFLNIFLVVLASGASLVGCQNAGDRLKLKPSASREKAGPGEQKTGRPVPPLAGSDRLATILNEINRTERALRNSVWGPTAKQPSSCATFNSTETKRGLFLTANYKDCRWAQTHSAEKTKFVYRFDGSETYERKPQKTVITSKLVVQVSREGTSRILSRPALRAVWVVSGDETAKTRAVSFKEAFGLEAAVNTDYWVAQISDGEFAPTAGPDHFKMLAGTALEFDYRPASSSKKAMPVVKSVLEANTDVEFKTDCAWPRTGKFTLRETDRDGALQTSTVTVSETGYRIGTNGSEIAWPQGQCLGQP